MCTSDINSATAVYVVVHLSVISFFTLRGNGLSFDNRDIKLPSKKCSLTREPRQSLESRRMGSLKDVLLPGHASSLCV